MDTADAERFATALKDYGYLCNDIVDAHRLRVYWKVLRDACSMDEFDTVCQRLMAQDDGHRVPMPAAFLRALKGLRDERQREKALAEKRAQETAAAAERLRASQLLQTRYADTEALAAKNTAMAKLGDILGAGWRSVADAMTAREQRWRRRGHTPPPTTNDD